MSKTIDLKINNVIGYSGDVTITTDKSGVPLDKFWRDRLKDAVIDNCVETIKPAKKKAKKETEK